MADSFEVVAGWLSGSSSKREALSVNHEEAETRLVLKVKDIIRTKYKQVIVMDGIRNFKAEAGYLVYTILSKLDTAILENILGFHGQTGCDTSSLFSGINKIKKTLKQYMEPQKRLRSLGRSLSLVLRVLQLR